MSNWDEDSGNFRGEALGYLAHDVEVAGQLGAPYQKVQEQSVTFRRILESKIVSLDEVIPAQPTTEVLSDNYISPCNDNYISPSLSRPMDTVLLFKEAGNATGNRCSNKETNGRDQQTRPSRACCDEGWYGPKNGQEVHYRQQATI